MVADPASVDPRFMVDEAKLDRIAETVRRHWPEAIHHGELQERALVRSLEAARAALLETLELGQLL